MFQGWFQRIIRCIMKVLCVRDFDMTGCVNDLARIDTDGSPSFSRRRSIIDRKAEGIRCQSAAPRPAASTYYPAELIYV